MTTAATPHDLASDALVAQMSSRNEQLSSELRVTRDAERRANLRADEAEARVAELVEALLEVNRWFEMGNGPTPEVWPRPFVDAALAGVEPAPPASSGTAVGGEQQATTPDGESALVRVDHRVPLSVADNDACARETSPAAAAPAETGSPQTAEEWADAIIRAPCQLGVGVNVSELCIAAHTMAIAEGVMLAAKRMAGESASSQAQEPTLRCHVDGFPCADENPPDRCETCPLAEPALSAPEQEVPKVCCMCGAVDDCSWCPSKCICGVSCWCRRCWNDHCDRKAPTEELLPSGDVRRMLCDALDFMMRDAVEKAIAALPAPQSVAPSDEVANGVRRDLGIRLGMGGGHESAGWYTEDALYQYVRHLESVARDQGAQEERKRQGTAAPGADALRRALRLLHGDLHARPETRASAEWQELAVSRITKALASTPATPQGAAPVESPRPGVLDQCEHYLGVGHHYSTCPRHVSAPKGAAPDETKRPRDPATCKHGVWDVFPGEVSEIRCSFCNAPKGEAPGLPALPEGWTMESRGAYRHRDGDRIDFDGSFGETTVDCSDGIIATELHAVLSHHLGIAPPDPGEEALRDIVGVLAPSGRRPDRGTPGDFALCIAEQALASTPTSGPDPGKVSEAVALLRRVPQFVQDETGSADWEIVEDIERFLVACFPSPEEG